MSTEDIEEMPAADPALLASANRMLSDRLAGVAHALRGSGLEGLKGLDDGDDLQQATAALTGAYQMIRSDLDVADLTISDAIQALAPLAPVAPDEDPYDFGLDELTLAVASHVADLAEKLARANALNEVLRRNFESRTNECLGLRAEIESLRDQAAAMLQYAQDAAETDKPWERWESRSEGSEHWFKSFSGNPSWYRDHEYRRKPEKIRIGDREINAPLRVAPDQGVRFWTPDIWDAEEMTQDYEWRNLEADKLWLERGLCFATEEDARACAEAMLELLKAERK